MEQQPYSNQYAYNDWTAGYATAWQATTGAEATAQYAAGGTQEVSLDEQWRLYYAQQVPDVPKMVPEHSDVAPVYKWRLRFPKSDLINSGRGSRKIKQCSQYEQLRCRNVSSRKK